MHPIYPSRKGPPDLTVRLEDSRQVRRWKSRKARKAYAAHAKKEAIRTRRKRRN